MPKPKIDPRENCIGCGNCQTVCPSVFKIDDDGLASVIELSSYDEYKTEIDQAIAECPVQVIKREN